MKIKTLVILLVVLGVLAGAGTLIIHLQNSSSSSGEMGAYLIEQLPANEISDLVKTLKRVKVGRRFASSEKVLKRLSLKSPGDSETPEEDRGARIRIKDKKGKPLLGILLGETRMKGKERKMPDGQYVMLHKGPDIYLIDTILSSFETGPSAWLAKSPVKVDAKEVKSISCTGPGGKPLHYRFERDGKGKDFKLIDPLAKRKIKKSSLNRLSNALSSIQIEDVKSLSAAPESIEKETSSRLEYHLFNGLTYRIYPGKACSGAIPCYLRIGVNYQKPGPVKEAKVQTVSSTKKKPATEKSEEELTAEATEQNAHVSRWVYVIPEWQHNAFFTNLDQMLEKKAEKKNPSLQTEKKPH